MPLAAKLASTLLLFREDYGPVVEGLQGGQEGVSIE